MSAHGHPWLKTPNIDKLAAEGIDFRQFDVVNPVCSPSRAVAMTGLCPARFSIHQHFDKPSSNAKRGMPDWLDPKAPLLSRFLKNGGYRTGHFGKWHLTNADSAGAPAVAAYAFDQAGVFNGEPTVRTRPIFWEWRGHNQEPDWWPDLAVREGDWKLLMTDDGKRAELYRLDQDRAEARDISSEHPEVVARLTASLREWQATLPTKPEPDCISKGPRRSPAQKEVTGGNGR